MKQWILAAVAALLLTGCGAAKVRNVLNDPAHYQGREVKLSGEVTRSTGAIVAGVYEIDDGTGRINVISNRPVPRKGAHVTVRGRVQSGVSLLGRNFGMHIQESSVKVRRD